MAVGGDLYGARWFTAWFLNKSELKGFKSRCRVQKLS